MKTRLQSALPTIGFAAAFWPLGMWYAHRLTDGGDEPLGLLVLLLCGVLIYNNNSPPRAGHPIIASFLLILYAVSDPFLPPMLRCIPALLAVAFYYGWHRIPGWLALITLSLPVVASMQFYLGYPMRIVSAEITSWLLHPFVDGLIRNGTTLSAHGKSVGVDAPCSGIHMLWAALVFANVITSITHMPWLKTLAVNLLTLTSILIANSLRTTLLYAPESGIINIPDWAHSGTGILCYLLTALILAKAGTARQKKPLTRTVSPA